MQPKKYDSFQPKRASSIDGFFSAPASNRPRKPVFGAPPAQPQPVTATLRDMPKRRVGPTRPIASSATLAPVAIPSDGFGPEQRRRKQPIAEQPVQPTHKPGRLKRITKRSGLILGAVILVFGLWLGFRFFKDIARLTGNGNPLSLLSAFTPAHLKNQEGRVNILVAGNSNDDAGHEGANLTDSIMVLSINTRDNTALMLSVPRDLWVNIPGVGHSKINAAYSNGGMPLLQDVVESNLGVTINYTVLVNYSAFKDLVNAIGGISITIKSTDPRGIYDPSVDYTSRNCCALAKYPNGTITLNGKQALNLARARGDAYGSYGFDMADFDRTEHQRQMLVAIKDKASSSSVIANPLKVASLVDAVGKNVTTNLQLDEIETLYTYMKKVNDSAIDSHNINSLAGSDKTLLANYTSPNGQSALIPAAGLDEFSDIQAQILKLLSNNPLVKEAANVVVLNGTDTAGLARLQGNRLTSKGMNVLVESNASAVQATTTIIDNSLGKKPNTIATLKQLYGTTTVTNAALTATYPSADIILVLGQNVVANTTGQTGQ